MSSAVHRCRAFTAAAVCAAAVLGSLGLTSGPAAAQMADAPTRGKLTCATQYPVVAGDSWYRIAKKAGITTKALYAVNAATAVTPLYAGTTICLPDGTVVPTPATTTPATTPATTTPATTTPSGPLPVQLASFPMQGPCWFSDTWQAPRGGGRRHEGVDFIAKSGQFIYAVQDGTLTKQTLDRPGLLSGNAWWLTAADGTYFFYAHLSAFAPGLNVGSRVVAGQVIGFVGKTGNAGGPHLHFEVHPRGGAAVNPTSIVKAVDGCRTTTPPPQPSGTLPTPPAASSPSSPAPPATTAPAAPVTAPIANTNNSGTGGGRWQFIAPKSVADATLSAGVTRTITVNKLAGVPVGTTGVLLRLTARSAGSSGYLVTHPCDAPPPVASTLSVRAGVTSVGSAMVEVIGGTVCATASTSMRLKVEVLASRATNGVGVQPVTATRVLDTRSSTQLGPGVTATLTPAQLGVVSGTQALTATVTIVDPTGSGIVSMGFCGQGPWTVPVSADRISSFAMTMRVSSAGWCLTTSVPMHVIVDIVGVWAGTGSPGPVDPLRVFDSRSGSGAIGATARQVQVAGVGPIPQGATTAMLSITAVTNGAAASVYAFPCGEGPSTGSVVAASPNRATTAVVPVRLGGGAVCISTTSSADVVVDVLGAG
ncbi:MAG: LysM peptidoglycan-binding domain-containing M23 family metallopeptidase [Ilumatobacteraceae bacterium]